MKPKILLGLGNPGAEYANTPHNMGAAAVREWADRAGLDFEKGKGPFTWTRLRRGVRAVIPTTYMNVCGLAVSKLLGLMDLRSEELLVVTDDVWLTLGRLRLRASGSDGGHNGLKSVAEALGTQNYPRLRIGVGPVPDAMDWADFVLEAFSPDVRATVDETIGIAADALDLIVARGLVPAQNAINATADEPAEKNDKTSGA